MDEAPNSEDARSTAFLKRGSRIRPGMHMHRFVAQANRSTTRFSTNEAPPCLGEVALFASAMLHSFQAKLLERRNWTPAPCVSYGGFSGESFEAFTAYAWSKWTARTLPALDRRHLFCFPKGDNHANSMTKWNLRLTRSPM